MSMLTLVVISVLLFMALLLVVQAGASQGSELNNQVPSQSTASQQKPKKNRKQIPDEDSLYAADPSRYVGADTCKACREQAETEY